MFNPWDQWKRGRPLSSTATGATIILWSNNNNFVIKTNNLKGNAIMRVYLASEILAYTENKIEDFSFFIWFTKIT